jgi:predicted lipid-binding transport protein (Tim44 family)
MRVLKMAAVSLGLALASPGLAVAQEAFVAGAITGALTGGLAGGPIGAAIGGLAGAAIGGAAEAEHARRQSVRPIADLGSVAQAYPPPQRPTEAYPRRTAHPSSAPRTVPVQPTQVQRQQLASAVSVMERTCVRDRAGNQTCREVIR